MRNFRRVLMLLLATSLLSSGLSASLQTPARQNPPRRVATSTRAADPFIGVWKLSAEKSKYEAGGAPKSFTRTYEDRGGGTIFMTTDVTMPQGSARAYVVYRRDGKPYPEAAVGAESIRMITVKAVNPRTEDIYFIVDGKPSEKPNTVTISDDGMTMTQVVIGKNSKGQPFTNTVVYDRQS
jgi:hypothetical protein